MKASNLKIIQELREIRHLKELDYYYLKALQDFGFEKFTYTYYGSDAHIQHQLCTAAMQGWHEHFQASNYEHVDTIGQQVKQSLIPVSWDLSLAYFQASGKTKRMFAEAIDYGLKKGSSIPIYGPNGFEAIQVLQYPKINQAKKQEQALLDIQQLAIHYHHCIRSHKRKQSHINLTSRELECLRLTERRLSAKEIAELLCISTRTVVFHLENINRKFKTSNKFHAVFLAKDLGMLN